MDLQDVITLLQERAAATGSQAEWARQHGIAQSYLNAVICGDKRPGKKILDALGLVKTVDYQPKDAKHAE